MDTEEKPISELEEIKVIEYDPRIDSELEDNVRKVLKNDIEFPIILTVKGLIITGYIISPKEYFKGIGDILFNAIKDDPDEAKIARDSYYKYGEELYSEPDIDLDTMPINYIHLKDAFAFVGIKEIFFGLWRGKLAEIDGFSWGTFKRKDSKKE